MTYIGYHGIDFFTSVELGLVSGWTSTIKFGRNASVGTTLEPIAFSGIYQTPTSASALEILSSDADDTSAGTGLRKVTVVGLNSSWQEVSQEVTLNGTTPVALATNLIRVYRMYGSEAGSYANQSTPSQQGTITLRVSGAGATWATLDVLTGGFGLGQSLIGCYTVPSGYTAYVYHGTISIENTKAVSLYFFKRENANDVTSPYSGVMRIMHTFESVTGVVNEGSGAFLGEFPQGTDIGYMGKTASGTATASVEFYILLKAN